MLIFRNFSHFFERFYSKFEYFRIFSNVFERFQSFLNAFFLPILPNRPNLASQSPFLAQKLTSPSDLGRFSPQKNPKLKTKNSKLRTILPAHLIENSPQ